jgi:serine/threonine protein kinase
MELVLQEERNISRGELADVISARNGSKRYVIKKNRYQITEDISDFFFWLMKEKPKGLMIPVDVEGSIHEPATEIYEYVDYTLLDTLTADFQSSYVPDNIHKTLHIMDQLTSAASKIHEAGFVHRDLRARNVFVNRATLDLILFDYNYVKKPHYQGFSRPELAHLGHIAPEMVSGKEKIDQAVDVYSVGRIFFNLTHYTDDETGFKIPMHDVTRDIIKTIDAALAPKKDRYRNCTEFNEAIVSLL